MNIIKRAALYQLRYIGINDGVVQFVQFTCFYITKTFQ